MQHITGKTPCVKGGLTVELLKMTGVLRHEGKTLVLQRHTLYITQANIPLMGPK